MIVALLAWFDEEPSLLKQCVESLNGAVDHLIVVDGAYKLFPDAKPTSPPEQAEAIQAAAQMPVTVYTPFEPWENQLAKRRHMFDLGETLTTEQDWFLIIDADETLDPGFPSLEGVEEDVGVYEFRDDQTTGDYYKNGVRRAIRARRGIVVGPTHGDYRFADGSWIQNTRDHSLDVPAKDFRPYGMTHHRTKRPEERSKQQSEFYVRRAESDEELKDCLVCGRPAVKRVWTDWKWKRGPEGRRVHGMAKDVCAVHAYTERNRSLNRAEQIGARKILREAGFL